MRFIGKVLVTALLASASVNAFAQKYGGVIDKTVAVVGGEVIMISDIEQEVQMMRAQGMSSDRNMRCELLEQMMVQKLFLMQARLDSLSVNQDMVEGELSQRIDQVRTSLGGDAEVEKYFGKPLYKLRQEWREALQDQSLTQQEQSQVASSIPEITPYDVRQWIDSVKKEDLLAIQDKNPDDLMKVWATVADLDATLTDIPLVRKSPERFCMDDQLCAGYMHAGYPIMLPSHTAKELLDADFLRTKGDWGFFHEIGHNHQNYDWTFDGTGEVTVNFFTLYVMEKMCGFKPRETRMTIKQGEDLVKRWKEKGQTYQQWKSDPFLALEMFVRLQVAYGWEPFEKMFKEYRTLADAERPKNDDQKRDQWVIRFSKFTNANIASVFDAWKVPISEEARKACANYPAANEAIFAGLR